jgi:mRNA interferase RelE/StbE
VKRIEFSEYARSDIRKLDIPTAMRIFAAIQRFAETGMGDLHRLTASPDSRLRVGDYRVRFVESGGAILIKRVLHRRAAYSE